MNEFDGIVLAGGKSKRMGTDKSEIILDGKSFLQIQTEIGLPYALKNKKPASILNRAMTK